MGNNLIVIFLVGIIVLSALFAINAFAKQSKPPISKAEFASEIIQILKRKDPDSSFQYDAERDRIEENPNPARNDEENKTPQTINLGNIYLRAKSMTDSERIDFIDKFLKVSSESDEEISSTEFLQSLALRVRTNAELSTRKIYMARLDGDFPNTAAEIRGDLILELVGDTEVAVKMVSNSELDDRKLLRTSVFERARKNLENHTPETIWQKEASHIWKSSLDDDYDGARLIAAYPNFSLPFEASPVVYMPSHSVCLITDSDDPDILSKMIELGEEYSADHRPMSNSLWHFVEDGWRQWLPNKSHPAFGVAKLQSIKTDLFNYNEQKSTLDELHEKNGKDIFVANLTAYENDEDGLFTLSVLTIGVKSILPKSDKIAIVAPGKTEDDIESIIVEWDEVVSLLGEEDFPIYKKFVPVRYDLTGEFTEKQLMALRNKISEN